MKVDINEIWFEFGLPLKRFIMKRVSNSQDAEDILQEIYIKIHKNSDTIMNDTKVNAWLYRITRNTIIDYYRKKESIKLVELPNDLESENDMDLSYNSEIAGCLKKMVNSLPEKYREAVILTEFHNLTQKELSEKTGLTLSGAKSRVQRGRKMLKGMLLGCCNLEFDRIGNIIDFKHKSSKCRYCAK